MSDDGHALAERFVLFFDFLGTSKAAQGWPPARLQQFVGLLISIAKMQSATNISGGAQEDGSYRLLIVPEVTTFSDNVVVSYPNNPEGHEAGYFESVWSNIVCQDCIRILSAVADAGLRIGLLLRGGLSFGQLYHDGDVVFGEAMVDAYSLEKQAGSPRVLVSDRIIARLTHERPEDVSELLQDADEKWHLNYFSRMIDSAVSEGPDAFDQAIAWKQAHLAVIDSNLNVFKESDPHIAEKWEWFKKRFEIATERFRDHLNSTD